MAPSQHIHWPQKGLLKVTSRPMHVLCRYKDPYWKLKQLDIAFLLGFRVLSIGV